MVSAPTDPGEWLRENEQQVEDLADLDCESAVVARLALAYLRDEQIDDDLAADARRLLSPPKDGDTDLNYVRTTPTRSERPVTDVEFATAVTYIHERFSAATREQAVTDRVHDLTPTMGCNGMDGIMFPSPAAKAEIKIEVEAVEEER